MARRIKSELMKKILLSLKNCNHDELKVTNLDRILRVNAHSKSTIEYELNLGNLIERSSLKFKEQYKFGERLIEKFETDKTVSRISISPPESKQPFLRFNIDTGLYIHSLLDDFLGSCEDEHVMEKMFPVPKNEKEQVIIEYSSPNIAKPFHVGHLRSTIIGNYIANVLRSTGCDVTRLNYLGDWGTQFGLLQYGIQKGWYSREQIEKNPISLLLQIYIKANEVAEKDQSVANEARALFWKLESGDENMINDWATIRKFTVDELSTMYERLGIRFDEFHWESMYGIKEIRGILSILEEMRLLVDAPDGKRIVHLPDKKFATLVKSDGSSLYLTRDLAAAIDRQRRFQFKKMYYVVDNAQTDHFAALKQLIQLMKFPWADDIQHVKFGRIKGMSTRKGSMVLLSDVLDEAFHRMKATQIHSSTTKVDVDTSHQITETLALSAVLVHDLKQRRQKDYVFQWEDALQNKGDTGIRLQYTHCRLSSLEKMCGIGLPRRLDDIDTHLLNEPEMIDLARHLGRFQLVISDSRDLLEPCILVRYLFELSHSISRALKVVHVKNQPQELAQARLALFSASKRVLGMGLKLLGISPLDEM